LWTRARFTRWSAREEEVKAFGGYVERDMGEAGFLLMDERRTVPVVFGGAVVVGVAALEFFGLEVDPIRGTLKGLQPL